MEAQEGLQEDEVASALVDEVAGVEVGDSREEEAVASHQEAEVVPEVDFLGDVVDYLTSLTYAVWISRRSRFIRGVTCQGALG